MRFLSSLLSVGTRRTKCDTFSGDAEQISVMSVTPVMSTPWFFSPSSDRVAGTKLSIRSGTLRTIRTAQRTAFLRMYLRVKSRQAKAKSSHVKLDQGQVSSHVKSWSRHIMVLQMLYDVASIVETSVLFCQVRTTQVKSSWVRSSQVKVRSSQDDSRAIPSILAVVRTESQRTNLST